MRIVEITWNGVVIEHDLDGEGFMGSCSCAECIDLDRIIMEEGYGN